MDEVRLIDANALIEEICKDCNAIKDGLCEYDICASVQWVSEAPTIDAVPVVRCKDCKHYKNHGRTSIGNIKCGWCYRSLRHNEEHRMLPDDFCSYGERREEKG